MKTKLKLSLLFASSLLLFFAAETNAQSVRQTEQASLNRTAVFVPPGQCTIVGFVSNDKFNYRTTLSLYRANGSSKPVYSKRTMNGHYSFPVVMTGNYLLKVKGNYPGGGGREGGLGPSPPSQRVTCEANGRHTVNFSIEQFVEG